MLSRHTPQPGPSCTHLSALHSRCPAAAHHRTAQDVVSKVVQELGRLDVLVNNASEQHVQESLTDITPEQLQKTFATNVFGYFYFAQIAFTPRSPTSWCPRASAWRPARFGRLTSTMSADTIEGLKSGSQMGRPGQPAEVYVTQRTCASRVRTAPTSAGVQGVAAVCEELRP